MRVFVAGASGMLGRPLIRRLADKGYTVTGLTRSSAKRRLIEEAGARAVVGNALDRQALARIMWEFGPSHVVNLLTAFPAGGALRAKDLRATNVLRTTGAANVLETSIAAGVKRLVAESFVVVYHRPDAHHWLREEDTPGTIPARHPMAETIEALRRLEDQHAKARFEGRIETVVLRYGLFYGPAVPSTDLFLRHLRAGRLFFPKRARGVASWIHIEDAAAATVAALEHPAPGALYNIADDEPMTFHNTLLHAARAFDVPPPRAMPMWLVSLTAPVAASMVNAHLALDNRRARQELRWSARYPNVAAGFADLAPVQRRAA